MAASKKMVSNFLPLVYIYYKKNFLITIVCPLHRYIGGDEVEPLREQTNATEVDSPKTWAAHSLLRVRGQRENHGLPIRCITMHPSSVVPTSAETRLDVHCMYIPRTFVQLILDKFLSMQNRNNRSICNSRYTSLLTTPVNTHQNPMADDNLCFHKVEI